MRGKRLGAMAAALALGGASGCLERLEVVKVERDGSLVVEHRVKGDGEDLDGGAAGFPAAPHFQVERSKKPREDGKGEEHTLVARGRFASAEQLPDRFGTGPEALRLSTRLEVKKDGPRTHYTFVRLYGARRWAEFDFARRVAVPEEVEQKLGRLDQLPWDEKRQVFAAFLDYERRKNEAWARQALETMKPDLFDGARSLLAARGALEAHFARHLTPEAVAEWLKLPKDELGKKAEEWQRALDRASAAAAAPADRREEFLRHLAAARKDHEVTDDLGDESFVVQVTLPGKLKGDNGTERKDATVTWRFSGKDLRDRAHVLVARSVVE